MYDIDNDLRCPKCHSMGMTYNVSHYVCCWMDCRYSATLEEIENAKHPDQFKKFRESLKKKDKFVL